MKALQPSPTEVARWLEARLEASPRGRVILPGLGVLKLVGRAPRRVNGLKRVDGSFAVYALPARQALVFRLTKPRKRGAG